MSKTTDKPTRVMPTVAPTEAELAAWGAQPPDGAWPPAQMAEYRLSVRARSHPLDIYEFTTLTFGQYQAEAYHAGLESAFSLLADFPRIGQPMDELASRHRASRSQPPNFFSPK